MVAFYQLCIIKEIDDDDDDDDDDGWISLKSDTVLPAKCNKLHLIK